MRAIKIVAVLAAAVLVLAACSGGGATPDENGEIVITMTDFAFEPNNITVKAGDTVTFILENADDDTVHEFMIGRDVETDMGFPSGYHENFFDGLAPQVMPMDAAMGIEGGMEMEGDDEMDMEEGGEDHGFMIMRSAGESARLTITIPSDAVGEWEFGCFEEDGAHYDDGMKGTLTVEA